jgi:hypothetical protein
MLSKHDVQPIPLTIKILANNGAPRESYFRRAGEGRCAVAAGDAGYRFSVSNPER